MVLSGGLAAAQTTAFSYQGKLPNSVTPATGSFEMEFRLFDAAAGGNQIGATVSLSNVVRRLRPIAFNWIDGSSTDVGFAAKEVNKIEPLLTTTNSSGAIEGMKYGQLTTVPVNAVKERQTQIESQQEQIQKQQKQIERQQQQQIDALKKLVCAANPETSVCQPNRID